MNLTDILNISGTGLFVYLKGSVASADNGFCYGNPGIVVAEDSGVLLVFGRIRGNLTKLQMILCVSGLQNHDTVLGIQSLFDRIQSALGKPFLNSDTCQHAEALGLNVNLTFAAFLGTNLVTVCIVSPEEPVAVPAVSQDGVVHHIHFLTGSCSLFVISYQFAKLSIFLAVFHKHTCNKHGFCHRSFAGTEGLEGFTGMSGEAVQIQTIVPVGTAD